MVPLTTVLALMFFPFVVRRIPRSPLLTAILVFFAYSMFHSSVALVVDMLSSQPSTRFIAWLRQAGALTAGVVTFLVLRRSLLEVTVDRVFRWIVVGFIPPLLLTLLNIAWGPFGMRWAGDIVLAVRGFMSPQGYTSPLRASGFANEPAAWATALVLIVLPAALYFYEHGRKRHWALLLLFLVGLSLAFTFSTIGLMLLLVLGGVGVIMGPQRRLAVVVMTAIVLMVGTALVAFPNNQIMRHARFLLTGRTNISFNDRFYGAFGPFLNLFSSYSVVGYGLGGVSVHFREVVPREVQAEILTSQWKEFPNLTILFGRVFAETGAVGLVLLFVVVGVANRQLHRARAREPNERVRSMYDVVRLGWISVCASLLISIGPYHTPFLWFYLALIDALAMHVGQPKVLPVSRVSSGGLA
jgi:uncharacterized membrane protein YqjE